MSKRSLILFLLPGLSGLLAFASFPKVGQGYLGWIALVPLLIFILRTPSLTRAFWGGFAAGFVQFLALLSWIPEVMYRYGGLPAPLAWAIYLLMAAVLAGFPAASCLLTRYAMNRGGESFFLIFPAVWTALEYARDYFPFNGFPWLLAGYSQTDYLSLIQAADITGVYGISFLLVWMNAALVWLVVRRNRRAAWPIAAGVVLLAGALFHGREALRKWGNPQPQFKAALLQQDISFDEPAKDLSWKYEHGYVDMADRLKDKDVDLLLLPESPSPLIFQYDREYRETLEKLARRYRFGLILNNITFESGGGTDGYYNSAYFLGHDGRELARYDKIRLVPFGEYIPYKRIFFFVDTISKDVSDFRPGRRHVTVPMGGHRLNALICYEAVFPDLARRFVLDGSRLIVNLTNDRWFGDSAAPYQHLAMARWRAVENRRYLLRAANSGISAVIAPTGAIMMRTPLLRKDALVGRFDFIAEESFYTRHGDVLPILCVIIVGLSLFYAYRRGRRKFAASRLRDSEGRDAR